MKAHTSACLMLALASVASPLLRVEPLAAQLRDQTRVVPTNDLPNPYRRVEPWGDVPSGGYDERTAYIGAEAGPDGRIYTLNRCLGNSCRGRSEPPVLVFDADGHRLGGFGAFMFSFPHGFAVDHEGNVWASDQRGHQVFKWSPEGEVLLTIGVRGEEGDPPTRLSEPTDVAISPNGDVFITEGHSFAAGANRVSKFRADGSFVMSWGSTGSGVGEFNVPHTIALDSRGRVFVGDRANNRIQIFNQDGGFLDVWYQFGRPSGIAIDANDRIYVADSESWGTDNPGWKKGIRVGSAVDGTVEYLIEDLESTAVEHSGAEGVGVDAEGNVYGAVVRRRMLERHEPTEAIGGSPGTPSDPGAAPGHIGHLATGFAGTPGGKGLVATLSTEAGIAVLHANFAAGDLSDLDAMRRHAEHVLHALDPTSRASGPGAGFGLIPAAEAVASHARLAADAAGAPEEVRTGAGEVSSAATSVALGAREAAEVARELAAARSIREASPLVARLRTLLYMITEGLDLDGGGRLELAGEVGVQQLEARMYRLLESQGLSRVLR